MRAGLSTIQQTLTSESAAVLNRSITEAARRCHGQTTPLHVAATLLAAPTGLLRQACIRSHPASSHPLQCRALELCFTVALDRLPAVNSNSASNTSSTDPPISNALMAALKRAQAHQRRGCPEQQQQPLLAVKVELEQLIVSILDDPSVSRVMREASFSSPAVKATIEQSLSSSSSPTNSSAATAGAPIITIAPKIPSRNLYMNPRLQQNTAGVASGDAAGLNEPQRVLDIMMRAKKRNPVVVADSDPAAVIRDVLKRLQSGDAPPPLRSAHVITLDTEFTDRSLIPEKIRELCSSVDGWIDNGGVVLDLGDLKWLVETPGGMSGSNLIQQQQQQQQIVSETGRAAIVEVTKLLQRYSYSGGGRLWVVASASCATYLRCQVYHPGMDNDWDLQALPIAPRSPVLFPRLGCSGILSSSVESLAPARGFPLLGTTGATRLRRPTEITDSSKTSLCKICMESYEQELSKLVAKKFEKSSSDSGPAPSRPLLPHWMKPTISDQIQSKPEEDEWKQSTEELLKTWQDRCSQQHQRVNPANTFPACIPLQTRLTISQSTEHAGNQLPRALNIPQRLRMQPGSPVKTDLVLGQRDRLNEFTACKLDSLSDKQGDSFDSFKKLYKGLAERVGWQPAAATAVATVVTQCKSGRPSGLRRKNEAWLMFIGPDKVGKRKMAAALSELVFAAAPITVNLVADDGGPVGRGRTTIDRVSDAVRRNPFSVVVLEGFDRADLLVRGSIKRAIESGRMIDSQGREVSLGSVIFVLDSTWLPEELRSSHDSVLQSEEEKILDSAGWQLEFLVFDRTGKRGAESGSANDRPVKKTKEFGCGAGLSLDLNLAAGVDGDAGEGSWNSSDLTFENGQESVRLGINGNKSINATNSPAAELMGLVDGAIEFKPVDFSPIRRNVLESIHAAFRTAIGNDRLIRVDDDALDIIVSGVWLTGAGVDASPFNEWAEKVLFPSMHQLKSSNLMSQGGLVIVRLSAVKDPRRRQWSSSLPSTVSIAGIGA